VVVRDFGEVGPRLSEVAQGAFDVARACVSNTRPSRHDALLGDFWEAGEAHDLGTWHEPPRAVHDRSQLADLDLFVNRRMRQAEVAAGDLYRVTALRVERRQHDSFESGVSLAHGDLLQVADGVRRCTK